MIRNWPTNMRMFGEKVGIAFQIKDDFLIMEMRLLANQPEMISKKKSSPCR